MVICIAIIGLILLAIWIAWGNSALMVTDYEICDPKIPESFSGFRIAQVSDLHGAEFGENNEKLVALLESEQPDLIVLTGDLMDSRRMNPEVALEFAEQAVQIAPTFFVTGNHEEQLNVEQREAFLRELRRIGVAVLEEQRFQLERGTDTLTLIGLRDPSAGDYPSRLDPPDVIRDLMDGLPQPEDGFTILLAHEPQHLAVYAEYGMDLVFSGHAHGGQFRIPFVGGVFAPGQGFFPEYDGGRYTWGDTRMIVSRGLGNSAFPFRINNRPELIMVQLESE